MMKRIRPNLLVCLFVAGLFPLAACGKKASKTLTYVPDDPAGGDAVSLRLVSLTETQLMLEVVGNGLSDVYGVAFRLQVDPTALQLVSMETGDGWESDALKMAQESHPGLLVATVTNRGDVQGAAAQDRVLARVTFNLLAAPETPIQFVSGRSGVIDSAGAQVPDVTWLGGRLERQ